MKKSYKYVLERLYPYLFACAIVIGCYVKTFNVMDNPDYKEVLNGLISLDSIILGFLGAVMPVVLSMKSESRFVKYVFEKDRENLFAKYLKATVFLGLINVILSLGMHVRECLPDAIKIKAYYIWIFISVAFVVATYRSMSYMISLVFSKEDIAVECSEFTLLSEERRNELKNKYKGE